MAPSRSTQLGEVVNGTRPGRTSEDETTVYKAMGRVIEDIVAADLADRTAVVRGVGQRLEL